MTGPSEEEFNEAQEQAITALVEMLELGDRLGKNPQLMLGTFLALFQRRVAELEQVH